MLIFFQNKIVMKEFNVNDILDRPKRLMQRIGIWPQTRPSFSYYLRALGGFTLCSIGTVWCLSQGIEDFKQGTYETGSYAFCIMLVGGHATFKIWFLITNKRPFFDIISKLEDQPLLYHDDEFDFDFRNKIQFSMKMFHTLVIVCVNAGISVVICEFVLGYEATPRIVSLKADLNQPILYTSVWIIFALACLMASLVVGTFEGLVLIFVSIGIAQLRILRKEIIRAIDCYPSEINLSEDEMLYYNRMVNHKLSKCVQRHCAIERYITSIQAKFGLALLVQYCLTLAATGFIGLNFIFSSPGSIDFLRCIFFFMADLATVFLVYYQCNEIILESDKIRDACYLSNWHICGPSVRKTLFIMMERSKQPFCLSIGKFSIISLDTFVVVLKTSMSYFTVLKSMYGEFD